MDNFIPLSAIGGGALIGLGVLHDLCVVAKLKRPVPYPQYKDAAGFSTTSASWPN